MNALDKVQRQLRTMANSVIHNYATAGLTSQLIGGKDHGKVRMLTADRDTREFITPHSHRYDFLCVVLEGEVVNTIYYEENWKTPASNQFAVSVIEPTDKFGKFWARHIRNSSFTEHVSTYKAGDVYEMTYDQIHSIRFSKGSVVLFLEGPERDHTSYVLEPFSDGSRVPTFSTPEWMFQEVKS